MRVVDLAFSLEDQFDLVSSFLVKSDEVLNVGA
jgi:hypothetical protein